MILWCPVGWTTPVIKQHQWLNNTSDWTTWPTDGIKLEGPSQQQGSGIDVPRGTGALEGECLVLREGYSAFWVTWEIQSGMVECNYIIASWLQCTARKSTLDKIKALCCNEWLNEWMNEWMNECMHACIMANMTKTEASFLVHYSLQTL
jgi:hypothetical protein